MKIKPHQRINKQTDSDKLQVIETPLHFILRFEGGSVGRYRRYPRYTHLYRGYTKGL